MEKTDTGSRRKPGEILRDLRKLLVPEGAKTLSQAKLADQMGYSEEYVQSVESGRKPMQPHFVDEMARFADDARFPDAFDQLIAELRGAVTAYWAGVDLPAATNPDDGGATLAPSPMEEVEGKLDGLRVAVDVLSARTEGRLDGLGGKFDRAEGTLSVLGNKLERTCANAETAVDASARTEA
ncbi:MAG TPA: helix-turn-helix transcriptional regulator, partial [Myxococcaceae bacterium]|nr:helix-turn-helix transcriptional regulator [Myxococcaceae bacterium]